MATNQSDLASSDQPKKILRVGIIGLGEIAQVNHISLFNNLSSYFLTTYLCDASPLALAHCSKKVAGSVPKTTSNPEELISSPLVDVILICNANAFHAQHCIFALSHNKYVLCEKPLASNYRDIDAIIAAEEKSRGRVFVAYQRRYAQAFVDAVEEVGGMDKVQYARVRDIIGPNSTFVSQSGTFPQKFSDFKKEDTEEMLAKDEEMTRYALEHDYGVKATQESMDMARLLSSLGSHDLSAMRELLGMPTRVLGASLNAAAIWTVLFQYPSFPCTYESGINNVPIFDAHIEVYSNDKIVRVNYDTPYVKGLPVTLTIRERIGDRGYQERMVRKTYEDPYTLEFLEFYRVVVEGREPKTSVRDARQEVDLWGMIMRAGFPNVD
ncbi:oxidoreductase family protein [Stipitochalara longipes BDJ]|nr:oxidoreductase family protein [Stipitochalara longipes BDJ]